VSIFSTLFSQAHRRGQPRVLEVVQRYFLPYFRQIFSPVRIGYVRLYPLIDGPSFRCDLIPLFSLPYLGLRLSPPRTKCPPPYSTRTLHAVLSVAPFLPLRRVFVPFFGDREHSQGELADLIISARRLPPFFFFWMTILSPVSAGYPTPPLFFPRRSLCGSGCFSFRVLVI